jgi:hypothetical protein
VRYPSDAAEIESCIVAEGICSGRFAQLAYKLAGRAAVHSPDGPAALPQACHYSPEEDQYSTPQACPSAALPSTLLGISPACCQARLMVLASLETGFQRFCAQALTSGAIAHRVSAHSLDWMRFDCHYVVVPTKQMGCEAALCLREDGADLDEVATRASSVLQQSCWYLEQVPPAWRYSLLGARQGAILGPLPMGDAWALCVVREKLLASVHDPDVCQRAEQDVLQGAMACEITRRVRWLVSL